MVNELLKAFQELLSGPGKRTLLLLAAPTCRTISTARRRNIFHAKMGDFCFGAVLQTVQGSSQNCAAFHTETQKILVFTSK